MTEHELALFWREPHLARLATINPDGTPHLIPIWYLHDGQHLLMITGPTSRKVRNIRRDPRVTLCSDRPPRPIPGSSCKGVPCWRKLPIRIWPCPSPCATWGGTPGR